MTKIRTIRIPEELDKKAVEKAAEDNRTVNNWIVTLIARAVEEED